ncbi:unnamed protein product [Protopolystoma xenopodis]|uniref:Uncharacterized protein n=1 Tax=Protopolystoma xenopodis TaxID=117903 RepID=A0A3S5AJS6_9PLAT|nr:unnamed protein product [Protopolystoma xenopodis]
MHCRGSSSAEGVDETNARSKLQSTGAWMRTTFRNAKLYKRISFQIEGGPSPDRGYISSKMANGLAYHYPLASSMPRTIWKLADDLCRLQGL